MARPQELRARRDARWYRDCYVLDQEKIKRLAATYLRLQATSDRRLGLLKELYEFKLREDKGDPDYMPSDWWQDEVWNRVEEEVSDGR